ncbi:uncharacterized protein BCR38DRAFT_445599 [Pseudomassariella vexata]|uniref:Uncharacterized protein n=1 Tax=Pseudomassariella vexata TaxID=1141098 RepID=A0A1Y2DIN3_9PEZI|nr:uncharacterized protein BCR38DRAFT_445599 [Pseudomassariella vexata]ORY59088.1 hypothetical protein BCR38DRAFT_445599 [Pseudomassariella vexata]
MTVAVCVRVNSEPDRVLLPLETVVVVSWTVVTWTVLSWGTGDTVGDVVTVVYFVTVLGCPATSVVVKVVPDVVDKVMLVLTTVVLPRLDWLEVVLMGIEGETVILLVVLWPFSSVVVATTEVPVEVAANVMLGLTTTVSVTV